MYQNICKLEDPIFDHYVYRTCNPYISPTSGMTIRFKVRAVDYCTCQDDISEVDFSAVSYN